MNKIYNAFAASLPTGGSGTEIPGVSTPATNALGYLVWAVLVGCVIALVVQGGKMAIAHRKREEFDGSGVGMIFVGAIVAICATGLITGVVGVA